MPVIVGVSVRDLVQFIARECDHTLCLGSILLLETFLDFMMGRLLLRERPTEVDLRQVQGSQARVTFLHASIGYRQGTLAHPAGQGSDLAC